MTGKSEMEKVGGRCPICGAKTEPAYRPFCSARCRDIDLARWLGDGYAIAGSAAGDDEEGEGAGGGAGGAGSRRDESEEGD